MPSNPFHYGTPATGDNFAGREEELGVLVSRIRNQINVVLLSPRRYGKTSLLLRAEHVLGRSRPRPAIVHTNVLLCKDLATLAGRLVAGAYHAPGARWHRVRQSVPEFLARLRIRPAVAFDDQGTPMFLFGPSLAVADADTLIADVYGLLAEQAASRPVALVLDEFQAVTRHGEHLPELLKGLADEHPEVSLILAGSRRHLMERLVTAEGAPLYGMAQHLALGPIPIERMAAHLVERSTSGGKPMAAETALLEIELAGPVPNDIQHLAFEAYDLGDREVTDTDVVAGLERAVAHESDLFADRLSRLSLGQSRVLVALASGYDGPIFTGAFARDVELAGGPSVKKAIDALAEDDTLVLRDGRWVVNDPFFAAWLRQAS